MMWGPDGAYYDRENDVVWLWYISWGGYYWAVWNETHVPPVDGLFMRSNLIRVTPGSATDFSHMHVMRLDDDFDDGSNYPVGSDDTQCQRPFSRNRFLSVAPVAFSTNSGFMPLGLASIQPAGGSGALLFGTPGATLTTDDDDHNVITTRDTPVYLGYFVPPAGGVGNYRFYVLKTDWDTDASPWQQVDDDDNDDSTSPSGYDQTDASAFLAGDDDAYGEISAQAISLNDDGVNGRSVLLVFNAANNAANPAVHEIRFARVTNNTSLGELQGQLQQYKISGSPYLGYGDYLVPASLMLKAEGGECHLYYDRVVSTLSYPSFEASCIHRHSNYDPRNNYWETYGTVVIKSVANMTEYFNDWNLNINTACNNAN